MSGALRDGASAGTATADFTSLGIVVGHATDAEGGTGLTVVRGARGGLRAAAAVLGRATGTRELHAVAPEHLVERVDAVMLTGGSAYGLDAAAGVMRWMEERGRGFPVGPGVVPIVPAAVIFDLAPFGRFDARPTAAMAYEACERATARGVAEGSVGAGTGATVGKAAGVEHAMKGGVGCAVVERAGAPPVGAVAVVNAFGDVRDVAGRIVAGARADGGGFLDSARLIAEGAGARGRFAELVSVGAETAGSLGADAAGRNTTIALVAVGAPLSRAELAQVARAATAALHRRITPAGTTFDGDVVFAVAAVEDVGEGGGGSGGAGAADAGAGGPPREQNGAPDVPAGNRNTAPRTPSTPRSPMPLSPAELLRVEALAVLALEQAVERAVRLARGRDGVPGLADDAAADRAAAASDQTT
ncbi:MAG: P1 family peptidase [Gemmatimonadaceae bacterium]